ncbi:MAG: hypothetical protein PHG66_00640 [Candidatus Colwellbacteria bacterium]|nr:hypothetical protein [Candidatus Colwellbacteria bacterium]
MTHLVPTISSPSTMNSTVFPSFIPIADVIRLVSVVRGCTSDRSPEFIFDYALKSGAMSETQQLINESAQSVQIETTFYGNISRKVLSKDKWAEIREILLSENIIVGYDIDDDPIRGRDFLDYTDEETVHPDIIIAGKMNPSSEDDSDGYIETMLELVEEHQAGKLKDQQKAIKKQTDEKETVRMRLLTTDQPQNITVKKVDGLYVVQNSFKFVLDPPKERLVVGIYNPDKTIRTKLSSEEISTCALLKLKIKENCLPGWMEKKSETVDEEEKEIQPKEIIADEKVESSDDDLSPFGSPGHSNVHPHPMFTAKSHHKYVSYLNILSELYNTEDGLDDEVWTGDLIARVDARLHGTDIGHGASYDKITKLRNMGTSYNEVYITSKNQPNKRAYKILSDHTLTDILEGTRVFAGNNTVIDYFDVDEKNTTSDSLHLIVNWLH